MIKRLIKAAAERAIGLINAGYNADNFWEEQTDWQVTMDGADVIMTESWIQFGFKDRIRVLFSGRLVHESAHHTKTVAEVTGSVDRWEIWAPRFLYRLRDGGQVYQAIESPE